MTRILLEQRKWSESVFVTLTYSDECLPRISESVASLEPLHLQKFLKRLRSAISPARFKYYAVGEYGREGERAECWNPHYHIALFGFPNCERGNSDLAPNRACECAACRMVRDRWAMGRVHLGELNDKSAAYIAGYIVEKLRGEVRDDYSGRREEFARMSLRSPIGADALHDVAISVRSAGLDRDGDAPAALRVGKRILPIGRTMRRRLRVQLGREANAPEVTIAEYREELRPLWEAASVAAEKFRAEGLYGVMRRALFRKYLIEVDDQRVRQLRARIKLFERGRK